MARTEKELLAAWEVATREKPLELVDNEIDILTKALAEKNKRAFTSERKIQVAPRFPEYKSQIDGSIISDRAQHREHLKRHGATEIGDAYDKDVKKLKEAALEGKERSVQFHEEVKSSGDGFKRSLYQRLSHEGL